MSYLLLVLFSIVSLISFFWLVVLGFKRHVGWGLAIFFLSPLSSLIYAIMHWREARAPFLINLGSGLLIGIVVFNIFSEVARQQIEGFNDPAMQAYFQQLNEQHQRGEITLEEMQQKTLLAMMTKQFPLEGLRPDLPDVSSADEEEIVEEVVEEEEVFEEDVVTRRKSFIPLSVDNVGKHVGDKMKVYSNDGIVRSGTLERIEPDSLHFQQRVFNGTMLFEVRRKDIRRLEVLGFRDY